LEAFFAQQGQSLVAMGHSRGAVASLMLAVRRPDLVRALILIDPTILPFSWMWWWYLAKKTGLAKHVPIAARAARRKAIWPDRETVIKAYKGKGAFKDWTPGFLEGYLADGLRENGNGSVRLSCSPAWEARCFAVCDHDVWSYVPRPTQPVLVLYGQRSDTFLPAAVRRFQKAAPLAEVVAVEGTGHFVPMEKPEETVRLILDFLRRHRIIDAEGA
jgi:pimeloyl-ACP methyl ester carboxylesterase